MGRIELTDHYIADTIWWGAMAFWIGIMVYNYVLRPRGFNIRNPFAKKTQWGKRYGYDGEDGVQ